MKRDKAAWDKQTIEMVDALLTHGRILRDHLQAEYRRLRRLPDDEWEWLSDEAQEALADLKHSDVFTDLLHPRDNVAMELITRAAELIRSKPPEMSEEQEKLAAMMLRNSIPTGHGDTFDDLINEIEAHLRVVNGQMHGVQAEIILAANRRIHQLRNVLEWSENNCPGVCAGRAREVLENTS